MCKNESEAIVSHAWLKDKVNAERVGPKASRESVPFKTGMVKDVVSVEEDSMASTKHC